MKWIPVLFNKHKLVENISFWLSYNYIYIYILWILVSYIWFSSVFWFYASAKILLDELDCFAEDVICVMRMADESISHFLDESSGNGVKQDVLSFEEVWAAFAIIHFLFPVGLKLSMFFSLCWPFKCLLMKSREAIFRF